MGRLINIDNGGTLTDICVIDGGTVHRAKTLTTPHDLSQCLFSGLSKVSQQIYGKADVLSLITSTDHIRYSTTQGTNALVERKGPRIGLLLTGGLTEDAIRRANPEEDLYEVVIGSRVLSLDINLDDSALEFQATRAVNALASGGANRIVVAHGGADRSEQETRIKNVLLRRFPQHLLGAIPILYTHELVEDDDDVRRTWTAVFNAFLHPAMERFLYNAEHKLRAFKTRRPLLIFRNDGYSARVAKTIALKTYSSGPRGGMEGAKALAKHYDFDHLVTMDVGGTTTDIGEVRLSAVRSEQRGHVEGTSVSFPLSDIRSIGVGGSSILQVVDGKIKVGPESVGSTPGPACFGLGGTRATITDAALVLGLLDADSFFGGELKIDLSRARTAIKEQVADPLGLDLEAAATAVQEAWVARVADGLKKGHDISEQSVLAAFGGAGPLLVCQIAAAAGIRRILIPGLAAVFSAYGLGFSDIGHEYEAPLREQDSAGLKACVDELTEQAERGMYAEGFEMSECQLSTSLLVSAKNVDERRPLANGSLPKDLPANALLSVSLTSTKSVSHPPIEGSFGGASSKATSKGERKLAGKVLPVYRVENQKAGASAAGPAVLEEDYFTCLIDSGWAFEINDRNDILLCKQ